jgi:hypothetical protein
MLVPDYVDTMLLANVGSSLPDHVFSLVAILMHDHVFVFKKTINDVEVGSSSGRRRCHQEPPPRRNPAHARNLLLPPPAVDFAGLVAAAGPELEHPPHTNRVATGPYVPLHEA